LRSGQAVEIDGGYGEGGGSVVRVALAVSALTGQAAAIRNVRGGLRRPGVSPVDAALARALADATGAEVSAQIGDDVLLFAPSHPVRPLRDRIDLNAIAKGSQPGSATLILQSLLTPLARAGAVSRFNCRGGTHVPFSPTFEYFRAVTLPAMARCGIVAFPTMEAAGYPPRGGGEVSIEIEPSAINSIRMEERGQQESVRAFVVTSELPDSIAKRGVDHLHKLAHQNNLDMSVETVRPRASSPGAAVTCTALFENGFGGYQSIGQQGKPMEAVCEEAFFELIEWLNGDATADEFLADHLVLPVALCSEESYFTTSRITPTLLTAAWVIKQFMPAKITIIGKEGSAGKITAGG
jgi:RNA 3'-terminal phosphate cyclase (ATP)